MMVCWPLTVTQQPTGTIAGQVLDSASRQPLAGVTIVVEGTRLGTVSRDDGTFTIGGVPAGSYTLRARRIGFAAVPVTVNVESGATVAITFVLDKRTVRFAHQGNGSLSHWIVI